MVSTADADAYKDREHAEVKHHLLRTYFARFLMILGKSAPKLAYVDAFSGPWKSQAVSHADTSFGLAWKTAVDCSGALAKQNPPRYPQIRQKWIEADLDCFRKLEAFAASCKASKVHAEAMHGKFEERISDIVKWIGDDYAFVLIDPMGYKNLIESNVLKPLLEMQHVEVLINYMWQFVNYASKQDKHAGNRANMERIFGPRYAEISVIPDQGEREEALLAEYELRLRTAGGTTGDRRARVMSFPIHYATQEKTKYYLVYVTHSAKGLITFAEDLDSAADKQQQVFYSTHERKGIERTGTGDMFAGLSDSSSKSRALTEPWLRLLPVAGSETRIDENTWAMLLEQERCRPSELQKGLQLLLNDRTIENLDDNAKRRRTHFVHYNKAERLKRLR
jgi:three-Cys-motif partner protein